ncbi:unnamed protein product, partial [Iphiclides podalirius]
MRAAFLEAALRARSVRGRTVAHGADSAAPRRPTSTRLARGSAYVQSNNLPHASCVQSTAIRSHLGTPTVREAYLFNAERVK